MRFRRRYRPTLTYSSPTPESRKPRALELGAYRRLCFRGYACKATPTSQNRNLRAFGISFPGVPEVVGPFSNYDFRLYAEQNIVDLQSYRGLKASERALDAGKMDYQDARDLIVRAVAASISTPSLPRRESMPLNLG